METRVISNKWRRLLLIMNCSILFIGQCGGPLILRLYFIKGGKRIWFSSLLQTVGFPLIFIPLTIAYFSRRKTENPKPRLILMNLTVFMASSGIGILIGLGNYLYSAGVARLPVSTSSLIAASQLAFTAFFAFILVKQRFTAYTINAIVLLTVGAGILALDGGSDKPEKETKKLYVLGFIMTVAAAGLGGLIYPLVELMYLKAKQAVTFTLVLEIQAVMCFVATVIAIVAMIVNHDFQAIPKEAREFELGKTKYYIVIVFNAILNYCFFVGFVGVIFSASSLFSGIIISLGLPITELLAVIFYGEKFQATKSFSLALSIWGFVSYFYGEIKLNKKAKFEALPAEQLEDHEQETETTSTTHVP